MICLDFNIILVLSFSENLGTYKTNCLNHNDSHMNSEYQINILKQAFLELLFRN